MISKVMYRRYLLYVDIQAHLEVDLYLGLYFSPVLLHVVLGVFALGIYTSDMVSWKYSLWTFQLLIVIESSASIYHLKQMNILKLSSNCPWHHLTCPPQTQPQ